MVEERVVLIDRLGLDGMVYMKSWSISLARIYWIFYSCRCCSSGNSSGERRLWLIASQAIIWQIGNTIATLLII